MPARQRLSVICRRLLRPLRLHPAEPARPARAIVTPNPTTRPRAAGEPVFPPLRAVGSTQRAPAVRVGPTAKVLTFRPRKPS